MTASRSTARASRAGPLGGAETAFIALAEALAARGHRVEARSRCRAPVAHNGVAWAPLASGAPDSLRSADRQSRRTPARAGEAGRAAAVLAAQSGALSEKAAQSVAARALPADAGRCAAGIMPARCRAGCRAAARRSCPTGCSRRSARPRRASRRRRAPCSPRTRCAASIGCSISGRRGSRLQSRERSCTSIAGRPCMAADGDKARRMEAVLARVEALHDSGVRRHRAGPARRAGRACWPGRGSCCTAAIPARPSARRWPRRSRSGCRSSCSRSAWSPSGSSTGSPGSSPPMTWRSRRRQSACCATTRLGGAFTTAALARQRGLSWDEVASRYEALIG